MSACIPRNHNINLALPPKTSFAGYEYAVGLLFMPKLSWMKWYPADWMNDTRALSAEAKGCLIDILCLMWNAPERGRWSGTPEEFARVTGIPWESAPRLIQEVGKALGVTKRDSVVTLENRRMIREDSHYKNHANRQRQYRHAHKSDAIVTHKTQDSRLKTSQDNNNTLAQAPKTRSISFQKPTSLEVKTYAESIGARVDGEQFCAFYESNGWKVGRNPMKSWQAAVVTWKKRDTHTARMETVAAFPGIKLKPGQDPWKEDFERSEKETL